MGSVSISDIPTAAFSLLGRFEGTDQVLGTSNLAGLRENGYMITFLV